jgi:hypothetical protein
MLKTDIQKLRIDIKSGQESALSLLISRDGVIGRQGSGVLPADPVLVQGKTDGNTFTALLDLLDEQVFPHADVYDHPNKLGIPITCSIVFQGQGTEVVIFEFRFGSETPDVGELLPYFDSFIGQALGLTEAWYTQEKNRLS